MDNAELELLGMNEYEMHSYWQNKSQQDALSKTDPINRGNIKASYIAAMGQLEVILGFTSPTNAQVVTAIKQEAQILKNILLYLKSDIE